MRTNMQQWLNKQTYHEDGNKISDRIKNESWWRGPKGLLALTDDIVCLLRVVDGPNPTIPKFYGGMLKLNQTLKAVCGRGKTARQ